MTGGASIELSNLRAGYSRGRALLSVEALTVPAGALTVLLGQNGSGKSTLLRTLAGQLPYEGSARIGGLVAGDSARELCAFSPRARARRIAYLPQQLTAPEMDVETLVAHGRFSHQRMGGTLSANDRELIERAMERTDVAALRARRLRALSGGERQRAYLAMVIAQDAPFLLLDEPCASLDIAHQGRILSILKELAAEGRGILMASHDIPQGLTAGDAVCLLHRGALRFAGAPEALAARRALLAEALGVGVRRIDRGADAQGERLLYAYALTEAGQQEVGAAPDAASISPK